MVGRVPFKSASAARRRMRRTDAEEPALSQGLFTLRVAVVGLMFLITVTWPLASRTGDPLWLFVLVFAVYDAAVETLRLRVPWLRSYAWVALVDLVVASLLYYLDAEPGGPLFLSFFLALVTAAFSLPTRWLLGYLLATALLVTLIAPTLPFWAPSPQNYRELAVRMVILGLVGTGTALLTRRLAASQETAHQARSDAERMRELERVRADAGAEIAHDLGTPLAAARAAIGMLAASLEERLIADERRLVDLARRNVERLGLLIADLSASRQLDQGLLTLTRGPLDLRDVVRDAYAAMLPLLEVKRQTSELHLPEPLPITGDAWRLEHVIINLLANAHEHTPPGTHIVVAARVEGGSATVLVRDDGPGIPSPALQRIISPSPGPEGSIGGSGLGLTIAKQLTELHGGRLSAESGPTGTTVRVHLPIRTSEIGG